MILRTARLVLRRLSLDDVAPLMAFYTDPEACRFVGGTKTTDDVQARVAEAIARYESGELDKWAVVLADDGALVGRAGLRWMRIDGRDEIELGFSFARAHWGMGYAKEAAQACLNHGAENVRLGRVVSLIHPSNIAAQRIADWLGMRFEKTVATPTGHFGLHALEPAIDPR